MKKFAVFNRHDTWLFDLFADTAAIALRDAKRHTADAYRVELITVH